MSGENPADPRPQSQIEAEEGARDGIEYDWSARAGERESADRYAEAGIMGAPGSEVPQGYTAPPVAEGVRPPSQVEAEAGARGEDAESKGDEPAKAEPEKDGEQ